MWRACNLILFLILSLLGLIGFSSCGDSNQTSENKKYLSKNIVLNNNSALANSTQKNSGGIFALNIVPNSYAQSDNIDTETKLLAENVIFENTSSSQIESDNVQDALEEITLKLADVMIGTWDIQNVIQAGCHETTGKIIINDDGTFNLTEGSFAAIGMGSGTATDPMCGHTEKNQTYEVYDDELIVFKHVNGIVNNMGTPRLVKLRENKIIFVGSGGCSCSEEEKISILTRTTN
jgi:hypothetical protein